MTGTQLQQILDEHTERRGEVTHPLDELGEVALYAVKLQEDLAAMSGGIASVDRVALEMKGGRG